VAISCPREIKNSFGDFRGLDNQFVVCRLKFANHWQYSRMSIKGSDGADFRLGLSYFKSKIGKLRLEVFLIGSNEAIEIPLASPGSGVIQKCSNPKHANFLIETRRLFPSVQRLNSSTALSTGELWPDMYLPQFSLAQA